MQFFPGLSPSNRETFRSRAHSRRLDRHPARPVDDEGGQREEILALLGKCSGALMFAAAPVDPPFEMECAGKRRIERRIVRCHPFLLVRTSPWQSANDRSAALVLAAYNLSPRNTPNIPGFAVLSSLRQYGSSHQHDRGGGRAATGKGLSRRPHHCA
jgi:hypothetical protein